MIIVIYTETKKKKNPDKIIPIRYQKLFSIYRQLYFHSVNPEFSNFPGTLFGEQEATIDHSFSSKY